jgi:hypothetical protein
MAQEIEHGFIYRDVGMASNCNHWRRIRGSGIFWKGTLELVDQAKAKEAESASALGKT